VRLNTPGLKLEAGSAGIFPKYSSRTAETARRPPDSSGLGYTDVSVLFLVIVKHFECAETSLNFHEE
jgi:hypothetical protein